MSMVAEHLATLVGLNVFGWLKTQWKFFSVAAGTDNLANKTVAAKNSAARFPLAYVQMQLSHSLYKCRGHLKLNWRPRDLNVPADALTNELQDSFCAELRLNISLNDIDLNLLRKPAQHHEEVSSWQQRRKAKRDKTKWG